MNRVYGIDVSIAAFTNLTHEHLDLHNTFEEYANTKKMLFDGLSANSKAIFNGDDKYFDYMLSNCSADKIVVSSTDKNADYFIDDVNIEKQSSSFSLTNNRKNNINEKNNSDSEININENEKKNKKEKINISTALTAFFNVQNAALAIAICLELGIDRESILLGISQSRGAAGRLELVKVCTGAVAYVDYAHTPDALEKSLLACKSLLTGNSKLICVFGCGGDRDKTKRPLMGGIAEKYSDIVVVTDDNPRTENSQAIIDDILKGIKDNSRAQIISNRSEAIKYAVSISTVSDIILVAGKGHEDYQIIGQEKHYFNDVDELTKCN
jgi:UDP-N-acetylmuramyl-tripeptide synthetase